jgi:hypothetical protein
MTMKDAMDNSEFYHFGVLPQLTIHSPIVDQYSHMYIPRDSCDCGCSEWKDGELDLIQPIRGFTLPKKQVHRCVNCSNLRMADHKGRKETNEND